MANTGIVQRFGLKAYLEIDTPILGELVFATDTGEFGYLNATSALTWIDFEDKFIQSEFIDSGTGQPIDGGKPIKLNALGLIDEDMLPINAFTLIGAFTPVNGDEYPDITGANFGDFWGIENVDAITGYTFLTGDLITDIILNGDTMFWTKSGWAISRGAVNGDLYYQLDGTTPLVASFNGGGQQIKAISDGVDLDDAVSVAQLNTKFDGSANVVLDTNIALETQISENLLSYGVSSPTDPLFPSTTFLKLGQSGMGIDFDGVLFNPLVTKNNTAIQAWDSTYTNFKNIVSRTSTDTNTDINGSANYDNEIIVGDSDVVTALRATVNFDPVVRKGVYGSTTDYKIYTDEDFLTSDFAQTVHTHLLSALNNDNGSGADYFTTSTTFTTGLATKLDLPQGVQTANYVVASNSTNNGITWALVDKSYVGLDQVENFSMANYIISDDTQIALNAKQDDLGFGTSGQVLATNATLDGTEWIDVSSGGQVDSIIAGTNVQVDSLDPINPIINVDLTTLSINDLTDVTTTPTTNYPLRYKDTELNGKQVVSDGGDIEVNRIVVNDNIQFTRAIGDEGMNVVVGPDGLFALAPNTAPSTTQEDTFVLTEVISSTSTEYFSITTNVDYLVADSSSQLFMTIKNELWNNVDLQIDMHLNGDATPIDTRTISIPQQSPNYQILISEGLIGDLTLGDVVSVRLKAFDILTIVGATSTAKFSMTKGGSTSGTTATWGSIGGTLSDQIDLQDALDLKVDDTQVLTDVPSGALFTDTVYDDTTIQAEVDLNTAKVSYTDASLVATHTTDIATNTGAISTLQGEVDLNTAKVGITTAQASEITANTAKVSYTDATLVAQHTTDIAERLTAIGGDTASRPINPLLYTIYWDTDLGQQITCTVNTDTSNVWNLADGTQVV